MDFIAAHYGWVKNVKSLDDTVSYWQCVNDRRYFNDFSALKYLWIHKVISMIVYYCHKVFKNFQKYMVWKKAYMVKKNNKR